MLEASLRRLLRWKTAREGGLCEFCCRREASIRRNVMTKGEGSAHKNS